MILQLKFLAFVDGYLRIVLGRLKNKNTKKKNRDHWEIDTMNQDCLSDNLIECKWKLEKERTHFRWVNWSVMKIMNQ